MFHGKGVLFLCQPAADLDGFHKAGPLMVAESLQTGEMISSYCYLPFSFREKVELELCRLAMRSGQPLNNSAIHGVLTMRRTVELTK